MGVGESRCRYRGKTQTLEGTEKAKVRLLRCGHVQTADKAIGQA